jgi:hypothetical protein
MYRPCSLRLARRAGDSLSLRPRRLGVGEPRVAASRAGAKRASAGTIAPSDLRMAWTSLPTELARAFGKRTSVADVTGANGTAVPRAACEWRGIVLPRGCLVPPWYPASPGLATGVPEGDLGY